MRRLSIPKIARLFLLFIITILIALVTQGKPKTSYAAQCAPGECTPPEYVCQYGTMCCTGGGCPSWVCVKSGCTYKIGTGCYGPLKCKEYETYWEKYCTWHKPYCHSTPPPYHCHNGYWTGCWKTRCAQTYREYCGEAERTNGTCGWCTGSGGGGPGPGPGPGPDPGPGCTWGATIPSGTCTQANGLWGHYYRDNPATETDPFFDGGLKWERNDAQVNFDWGSGGQPFNPLTTCRDNFAIRWTGYINLPSSGNWRFGATSDDGFKVDLETTPGNWTQVFNDWNLHSPRTRWGNFFSINSGWYGIRIEYFENDGFAVAKLQFEGPGTAAQIVPSANLRTCSAGCSTTAPAGLTATAVTSTSAQLNWTPGTGGDKQLIRVDADQNDVNAGCPGGVGVDADEATGTKCVVKDDNVPSGQSTYGTGSVLAAGTRYYYRVVEYKDASCYRDASSSFVTRADPWVKVLNGIVHTNHLVSLITAPSGQYNARWLLSARGSITGNSQESWKSQYYPERNFNLTLNSPIKPPAYADLWKRFGGGATTYSGPTLPSGDGVYLINGNKTVSAVFNLPANRETLIFVNGNLTVDAVIQTPASSVLTFIVSGEIKFAKNLTGGGATSDSISGLYAASGRINTAYNKSAPDEVTRQLLLEGGLISLTDTIQLDRNLDPTDNKITPAEQIDLSAKYYVLLKTVLGRPKFFYREVPAGF